MIWDVERLAHRWPQLFPTCPWPQLESQADRILAQHGDLPRWIAALESIPEIQVCQTNFQSAEVSLVGDPSLAQRSRLEESLRTLRPWRKGPFRLFDVGIDAEWRSDQKWSRVAPHVQLQDKRILDVGCGNGYYGWRMIGAGAAVVIGVEPFPLYNVQHAAIKQFLPNVDHFVVPGNDRLIDDRWPRFDTAFSMGVLYHSRDPIGHLTSLRDALTIGGELVLETIVVEGDATTMLVPENRYAKMRNVWFLPSVDLLLRWLARVGFEDARVVDVNLTTTEEQRATDWMTFESLSDFLDPNHPACTIEGLPRPRRAIVIARRV